MWVIRCRLPCPVGCRPGDRRGKGSDLFAIGGRRRLFLMAECRPEFPIIVSRVPVSGSFAVGFGRCNGRVVRRWFPRWKKPCGPCGILRFGAYLCSPKRFCIRLAVAGPFLGFDNDKKRFSVRSGAGRSSFPLVFRLGGVALVLGSSNRLASVRPADSAVRWRRCPELRFAGLLKRFSTHAKILAAGCRQLYIPVWQKTWVNE